MPEVVPDECLEADIATLAQKGAGKTYANKRLVERLLDHGRRVVVLDPLGHWWGLKGRPDGSPGYPVVVIGGKHADVPLDPQRGEELGAFLALSHMPVIVDVSDLRRGELTRFAYAFLSELYRLNEEALWLVLEEADVFAPQQPMNDQTHLLSAVDQIARRGRARGFRLWSITQRPAKLHKDVLTQASTLLLLRLRAPQDRAAAEEWIKGHAEKARAAEITASLASLKVGEGYVWAPDLDLLARVTFPPIETLDTSSTPKAGEARVVAGELASADLSGLIAVMAPPPEEASDQATTSYAPVGANEALYKAARSEGFTEGYTQGQHDGWQKGSAEGYTDGVKEGISRTLGILRPIVLKLEEWAYAPPERDEEVDVVVTFPTAPRARPEDASPRPPSEPGIYRVGDPEPNTATEPLERLKDSPHYQRKAPASPSADFSNPQRRILNALRWAASLLHQEAIPRVIVAYLAEASPNASGFQNNLGALRTAGEIIYPQPGMVALTPQGRAHCDPLGVPPTMEALRDAIAQKLTGPQRAIFLETWRYYPGIITRTDLATRVGKSERASGFQNDLGRLRTLGLIAYPEAGKVVAADFLFVSGK